MAETKSRETMENNVDAQVKLESYNGSIGENPKEIQKEENPAEVKRKKRNILKNVFVVCCAFNLLFTAFFGLSNLASSLHREQGVGVISMSAGYMAQIIGSLLIARPMIGLAGVKWSVVIAIFGFTTYMAANAYAIWATMIPATIISGTSATILYTAQSTFFTKAAKEYADLTTQSVDGVLSTFFGANFVAYHLGNVFSSIISSTVLSQRPDNFTSPSDSILALCGANDCQGNENNTLNDNLRPPSRTLVYTLVAIYVALTLAAAILVIVVMDRTPTERSEKSLAKETVQMVIDTAKHLKHLDQVLLIPVNIYIGLALSFLQADFTNSYVSCSIGIWMVGLTLMPFAGFNAIATSISGPLVKYLGRIPVAVTGFILQAATMTSLLLWGPHPNQLYLFFVLAGLYGLSDGFIEPQTHALYGLLFPNSIEAAFANYRLWEGVGMATTFAYSSFLCTYIKLYIILGFLCLALICYLVVELRLRRQSKVTTIIETVETKL